jgi:alkylhydroperoxidase family enzyme
VATSRRLAGEKLDRVSEYRTSPLFSARERAALAFVEEATRSKRVASAVFDELRRHFADQEIVEITWVNAVENYFNLVNLPLEIESDCLCAIAERRGAA